MSTKPTLDKVGDLLRLHEGVRQFPYRDSVGKLTIGVGFNLDDVGLYPEEMDFILKNRLKKVASELYDHLPWITSLNSARTAVLLDMGYNLGVPGLLKFRKMIEAMRTFRWGDAAAEMLDSKWAGQVGRRAVRLAAMMETGQWPDQFISSSS